MAKQGSKYYPGQYVGCYVGKDSKYGSIVEMGQIVSINTNSETIQVKLYDLLGRGVHKKSVIEINRSIGSVFRCSLSVNIEIQNKKNSMRGYIRQILGTVGTHYEYLVEYSNGEFERVSENNLLVDISSAYINPKLLCRFNWFYDYNWYINRKIISGRVSQYSNMPYGFDIINGCRVLLLPHQISAIMKMLSDNNLRYLLADEVGLGKTVEAGAVIKVLTKKNNSLRVVYVLPKALIKQWQNELKYKFNIEAKCGNITPSDNHVIVSLEDVEKHGGLTYSKLGWDLLVVDEIHNLLGREKAYNLIKKLSQMSQKVLFLSATPIQERIQEYKKLLSLVQPDYYDSMDLEEFEKRLSKQNMIQKAINQILGYIEDDYEGYLDLIEEELEELINKIDDQDLLKRYKEINFNIKADAKKKIISMAISIFENHRINHNIIRTRRKNLDIQIGHRLLDAYSYEPWSDDEDYGEKNVYVELLEFVNNNRIENVAENLVKPLVSAMFSSPWALASEIKKYDVDNEYLLSMISKWVKQAEQELTKISQSKNMEGGSRLIKITMYIENLLAHDNTKKIVVFSEYDETVENFIRLLSMRNIKHAIFSKNMDDHMIEENVKLFQNDADCQILVCNKSGGEGRNFQMADMLIHIDLPWKINSLEQRIGRLDRLGRKINAQDITSVVFYAKGTLEEQLFYIFRDGIKVFEESICGMEIMSAELDCKINEAIEEDLYYGLENKLTEVQAIIKSAKRKINSELSCDSLNRVESAMPGRVYDSISQLNKSVNKYNKALEWWGNNAGLNLIPDARNLIFYYDSAKILSSYTEKSLIAIPFSHSTQAEFNKRYGTFYRNKAVENEGVEFYSGGYEIHDFIVKNAMDSLLGRCCAVTKIGEEEFEGIILSYSIEPDYRRVMVSAEDMRCIQYIRSFLIDEYGYKTFIYDIRNKRILPKQESSVLELRSNDILDNSNLSSDDLMNYWIYIQEAGDIISKEIDRYHKTIIHNDDIIAEFNRQLTTVRERNTYFREHNQSKYRENMRKMKRCFENVIEILKC